MTLANAQQASQKAESDRLFAEQQAAQKAESDRLYAEQQAAQAAAWAATSQAEKDEATRALAAELEDWGKGDGATGCSVM